MNTTPPKSPERRARARERSGFVRLADVAKHAHVSTATVSRAINEPHKVSKEVRAKVMAAAEELNWIPNAAGKALASSRTHITGAIIPTLDNEIFAHQVSGLQSVLSKRGFTLFLGCSNYDLEEGLRQAEAMLARGVEALAIAGENQKPELFSALNARRVPYVVTYSYHRNSPHTCIGFDNNAAFRRITEHLLSLGHKNFAGIFQPLVNNDRAMARLQGVRDALAAAGLELDPEYLFVGSSSLEFGAQSFRKLVAQTRERSPTAIICGNDNIALGALSAAAELGLSAPEHFSITGFDDLAISSRLSPPLTTMKIDNQKIGILAAQALLSAIDGVVEKTCSVELQPEFKTRKSTGPVPKSHH